MSDAPAARHRLARNPALLCAFHALQMSLFPMAVITLFWKFEIGMSLTRIMMLQGVFGLALAAFEFPSGYLADRIGYRRSMILASCLMILAWSIYSVSTDFSHVVVAELAQGIGMSLISGSDSALLYESLVESDREPAFGTWTGRMHFCGQSAEGAAALVSGALYAAWPRSVFVLEAGVWVVAVFMALMITEPARHPPPLTDNFQQIKGMIRYVVFEKRELAAVMFTTMVLGMSSFIPVWTIQLYSTGAGVPRTWLGPIWATANFVVALAALASPAALRVLGMRKLLMVLIALIAIGYLGLGLSHALWGFAFYFVLTGMRGLFGPALHHVENRLIPSADRAGFLSLRSFVFRMSFLVIGPAVGMLMEARGQHAVLLGLGAGMTSAAIVGALWMRRHGTA